MPILLTAVSKITQNFSVFKNPLYPPKNASAFFGGFLFSFLGKRLDFVFKRADNIKKKRERLGRGNLARFFFGQLSAGLNAVFASSWDISAKPRRQLAKKRYEFKDCADNENPEHYNYQKLKKLD